jgi:hypothetical protein
MHARCQGRAGPAKAGRYNLLKIALAEAGQWGLGRTSAALLPTRRRLVLERAAVGGVDVFGS